MAGIYFFRRNLLVLPNLAAQHKIIALEDAVTLCAHEGIVICHESHDARFEKHNDTFGRSFFFYVFINFLTIRVEGSVDGPVISQIPICIDRRVEQKNSNDYQPESIKYGSSNFGVIFRKFPQDKFHPLEGEIDK